MKITNALGTFVAVLALGSITAGCNDKAGNPTPTGVSALGVPNGLAADQSFDNQGSGSNFKIYGDADLARDPENPTNVVLKMGSLTGGVYRNLHNVQLWQLDHQLSLKYAFEFPRTCFPGGNRITLLIDADGNGKYEPAPNGPDFTAVGLVNPPAFGGCPTSVVTPSDGGPSPSTLPWRFEDFTDELPRWEITPGAVPGSETLPFDLTWDVLEQLISTAFPNHRVLEYVFEDSSGQIPGAAYYDLITVLDLTLGTRGQLQPERGNRNN